MAAPPLFHLSFLFVEPDTPALSGGVPSMLFVGRGCCPSLTSSGAVHFPSFGPVLYVQPPPFSSSSSFGRMYSAVSALFEFKQSELQDVARLLTRALAEHIILINEETSGVISIAGVDTWCRG